jgi:Leucine-rich repeat (LRR) protein
LTKIDELKYFTGLVTLVLPSNQIVSLESLENLTCLTDLHLSNNKITSIEKLKYLTNLTNLELAQNRIKSISCAQFEMSVIGRKRTFMIKKPLGSCNYKNNKQKVTSAGFQS